MPVSKDQTVFDVAWNAILRLREYVDTLTPGQLSSDQGIVGFLWDPVQWQWNFFSDVPMDLDSDDSTDSTGLTRVVVSLGECFDELLMEHLKQGTFAVNPKYYHEKESFWLLEADRGRPEVSNLLVPLRLYLPIILGGHRAKEQNNCFAMGHLAQTLDGKIASHLGSSKWISNEANLIHAHRLRALSDAVAVGWRTVVADNCQLTVRFVEGRNPTRVVIDPKGRIADHIDSLNIFSDEGPTIVLVSSPESRRKLEKLMPVGAEVFETDFQPKSLMKFLAHKGIFNLLVEGGGRTISSLITDLPILHLHFAPKILGSGIPSFTLAKVDAIDDSISLEMESFNLDNEVLLECTHLK